MRDRLIVLIVAGVATGKTSTQHTVLYVMAVSSGQRNEF
jgi:hypothetical protein